MFRSFLQNPQIQRLLKRAPPPEVYIDSPLEPEIQKEFDERIGEINEVFQQNISVPEKLKQLSTLIQKKSNIETECINRYNRLKNRVNDFAKEFLEKHLTMETVRQGLNELIKKLEENASALSTIGEAEFETALKEFLVGDMQNCYYNFNMMKYQLNEIERIQPRKIF